MTNLFLKVNKDLFKLKLNPTEILILAQIMEFNTNTGSCFISDKVLAESFGVSEKTISRTIKALEDKGFITRETRNVKGGKERHMIANLKKIEAALTKDNLSVVDSKNINKGHNDCCTRDNLSVDKGQNDLIKDNIKDKSLKDNIGEALTASAVKSSIELPEEEVIIDGVKAQVMTKEEAMAKYGLSACANSIPTKITSSYWINKELVKLL